MTHYLNDYLSTLNYIGNLKIYLKCEKDGYNLNLDKVILNIE